MGKLYYTSRGTKEMEAYLCHKPKTANIGTIGIKIRTVVLLNKRII